VLSLATDANGSVWVGTNRGVARYDTTWTLPPFASREEVTPRSPLLLGADGALYVGNARGFLEVRGGSVEAVGPREDVDAAVTCFAENAAGDLWVGTDQGLLRYDGLVRERHLPDVRTVYVEREWGAVEAEQALFCDRYRLTAGR
jgi:ligand-binding sensor domain-containing protein